ncbi:LacI family DNA-binding transcriptional regulator [Geminicoccus roseus]|uniref:LacI family DNA-binding transcriptional regulator n=1 Tax=Geminicoccus roseus TaxID=404900 RepID=UPI0004021ACA|nr:LacI family DNA-binding transcriptional regulator [Geminicoccus roseus]
MQDVAHLAGVSLITVSRVLREPQRVAQLTRERVQAAILQTGYVPNLVAGSLKSARTDIVAYVIPSVEHSMVAEIVRGLGEHLRAEGLHLLMAESGFSPEEEEDLVAAFLARRPDAMLLMGITHTDATRRMLEIAGIPVIELGNLTDRPIDMVVGYSNVEAARTITQAMIAKGRRRIGYIMHGSSAGNDRTRDRREGHRMARLAAGLPDFPVRYVEVDLNVRGGAAGLADLLRQDPEIDGVCCSNDILALGALYEAQRRDIDVPGRLAIAGFDDHEMASQCVPTLSTIRVRRHDMGQQAGRMLRRILRGLPLESRAIDVGFELVERQSS